MRNLNNFSFQETLEYVEKLPPEEQRTLLEIIKKRLTERRRWEISRNARETLKAVREQKAKYGDTEDLKSDLFAD